MNWNRRHLLDLESLSAEELTLILDTARHFKALGERPKKKFRPRRQDGHQSLC